MGVMDDHHIGTMGLRVRAAVLGLAATMLLLLAPTSRAASASSRFVLSEGATPYAVAPGPGDSVWFAGARHPGNQWSAPTVAVIGQVGPGGETRQFDVPLPSAGGPQEYASATALTEGPDGAVWFVASTREHGLERSFYGRVTSEGSFSVWALPQGDSAATSIARGPDGNLWITEAQAGKIARVTPDGQLTDYSLPTGSQPSAITAGPDGALWFTERGSDRIGRIETGGQVEEFPVPQKEGTPNQITLGPEGDLWFTMGYTAVTGSPRPGSSDAIGRITPTGEVRMFPVTAGIGGSGAITAGPGGRIWFETTGAIASIDSSGKTGPTTCWHCGGPVVALTVGPEGALWFGASHPEYGGGGGGALLSEGEPGYVGAFAPTPLAIGRHAPPVRGGRTSIGIGCNTRGGCTGELRVRPKYGEKPPTIGRRTFSLGDHRAARFSVKIDRPGMKLVDREPEGLPVYVEVRVGGRVLNGSYLRLSVPQRHGDR
jgi:virginiamycin B lyase